MQRRLNAKKVSQTVTAFVALLMLLAVSVSTHSVAAATTLSPTGQISAFGGSEALQFATLVASLAGVTPSNRVAVFSNMDATLQAQAIDAVHRGAVVVMIGPTFLPTPTLTMQPRTTTLQVDTNTGAVISATTKIETPQTISPDRLISIVQVQGNTPQISFYALSVYSPQQYQSLVQSAAQEVAVRSLQPVVSTPAPAPAVRASLSTAASSAPLFPVPDNNWSKKLELSYTYVPPAGHQLIARYEFYELNYWDAIVYKEYYRTDAYIDHLISGYSCGYWHCGPYVNQRQITINAQSGELYQYGPPTTNSDATVSVGVSFNVSAKDIGLTVSYQYQWTNPGVAYQTTADYVNSKINWAENFRTASWDAWVGGFHAPTDGSHFSYAAQPSAVFRQPVGNGFNLNKVNSTWLVETDDASCGFLCIVINLTFQYQSFWVYWSPITLTSLFTPPYPPWTPSGPTYGFPGFTYTYSTTTTSPSYGENAIWYQFSWGDGTYSTLGPYAPGVSASASHAWGSPSVYGVSVRAFNAANLWSGPSGTLWVSIVDFNLYGCSTSMVPGSIGTCYNYISSLAGFSGTVALSITPSSAYGITFSPAQTSVYVPPGSWISVPVTVTVSSATTPGYYWFTLTGTSGPLRHQASILVYVYIPCACGGGGSVARGTLITMLNGNQIPAENLKTGDQMLGYDTITGTFTTSNVLKVWTVTVNNMLIIQTATGEPFKTDANPHQTLWTNTADRGTLWLPVTLIKVGDSLFTPDGWVKVTGIGSITNHTFVMYDIVATFPYFANEYLDPIVKV